MIKTIKEIEDLKQKRKTAQLKAIQISKKFQIIKKIYFATQAKYENKINHYNSLDREYAFAIFEKNQQKHSSTKPYDKNKTTAAKALKALKALPEEMREEIIKNVQNGLF